MFRLGRLAVLLLLPSLAFGQVFAQTVTVTASQTAAPQPDQAIFSITVMSGIDKDFSDILAALKGSGIVAANFVGLYSTTWAVTSQLAQPAPSPQPQLGWGFQLSVPLAKVKDTTAALTALAQSIPQNNSGLSLTFQLFNTQASSQQGTCSLADLVTNARTQAQQLTSAAGLVTGLIQSISTSVGPAASCFLTARFLLGTQLMLMEPASITVVASRAFAVQPDQVLITLNVGSGADAGLDDVTAALQQAGISGATFLGVNTVPVFTSGGPVPQAHLQWTFRITAPLSNTKDTLATIVAAQQALAQASAGESLSFFVSGTQVSPQLAAAQTCPQADLVKDAQAQAQKVAAAAGVSAGTILDLGGGSVPALLPAFRAGDFATSTGFASFQLGLVSNINPGFAPGCSLTVTFRLQQ